MQQLARSMEDRHHQNAYIETTLFEKLYGMKQDYDLLCAVRGSCRTPAGVEVAKAYNGGSSHNFHSDSVKTILQMSKTAINSDVTVIEAS